MHIKATHTGSPNTDVTIVQFLLKSNDSDVVVVYIDADGALDTGDITEFSDVERGELTRTLPIQDYAG